MPLTSRKSTTVQTPKETAFIKQDNKMRKRKVKSSIKRNKLLETKSESAIIKPVKDSGQRQSLKEETKKRTQDEDSKVNGSKEAGSINELNEKLSGYLEMFGKIDKPKENSIRENVRKLLISKKNEVDIERLMALHLLSIKPAKKCFRLQFYEANRNEGEEYESRLLTRYSEILPHYIIISNNLDHCVCFTEKNRKNTKSTFMHLSINRQVEELINTTIETIRKSNPSKLEMLWLQAFDSNNVKKLLTKEKFRYLLTSMKYNLKWLLGDSNDVKTEMCELRDVTFYGVNKNRDYQDNTVFKIVLPELIYKEIMFDDRTRYHAKITDIGLKLVKGKTYLPPEKGLCIFQNPSQPAGIVVLSENGQFISLINGPDFNVEKDSAMKFSSIAVYVLFNTEIEDHSKEWEDIIKSTERKTEKDNDEELNKTMRKSIMRGILNSLRKGEKLTYTSKHMTAKRIAKLNNSNGEVKFAYILKDIISINRILRLLSNFTIEERELAMTSSNYGGLGFARIIIGKSTMQLIKEICNREVSQLQVTPMHNTNVLDTELSTVSLNIRENIDDISQEIYNFEHTKANKFFLTELETNKIKQFII